MRRLPIERTPSRAATDQRSQHSLDLATTGPDLLRDSVRQALSVLCEEERLAAQYSLLTALKRAGFNVTQHLLLLGIPATTAEQLTAPEIATVIRYVRINEPRAMAALSPVLSEILTAHDGRAGSLKVSNRAA
jgi:hypothetical protein